MKNLKTIKRFKELAKKYGFIIREGATIDRQCYVALEAINTDKIATDWIKFYTDIDTVQLIGNTDQCNIWFHETRKDFTPKKIAEFVIDLNNVFELEEENKFTIKELIDPEDWQEIADVRDAYADIRYI